MLVVFSPIFMVDTKIIFRCNFEASLSILIYVFYCLILFPSDHVFACWEYVQINPFLVNAPFPYPLKMSRFQGVQKGKSGLKQVQIKTRAVFTTHSQTSRMKLSCKFRKKAPSQMFYWVLNTLLKTASTRLNLQNLFDVKNKEPDRYLQRH